jgi:hypothetical protein
MCLDEFPSISRLDFFQGRSAFNPQDPISIINEHRFALSVRLERNGAVDGV